MRVFSVLNHTVIDFPIPSNRELLTEGLRDETQEKPMNTQSMICNFFSKLGRIRTFSKQMYSNIDKALCGCVVHTPAASQTF